MSLTNAKKYRAMTKADADELHHQLFDNRVAWAQAVAPLDAQAAELKSKSEEVVAPFRAEETRLMLLLEAFIVHNKELFQKPRKPKTAWGNYGLQGNPAELKIDDAELLKQTLHTTGRGHLSMERTETVVTTSFASAALLELLVEGITLPGCRLINSEEPKININDKLVDEAVKGIKG